MKIAVVILNYNGEGYLKKFLPSVVHFSQGATVVVADNCSTDQSKRVVEELFPSIRWVQNAENGGFALGYNQALEQLKGEFDAYLLLNSDVEVTENWLIPLTEALKNEKVVAVQPKILSYNEPQKFEHAGACGGFLDQDYFPFCRGRIFDFCEEDRGQYNFKTAVHWTSGAAMLIRSQAFHDVGGFDADFFAHMEEIDLCTRLRAKGWEMECEPGSVVYHVGGGTLDYNSPQKLYLNFRNNLFLIAKNHQGLLFPKLFKRMALDGIAAFKFLSEGKVHFFWKVFLSHMALYQNFPVLLKKRQQLRANKSKFSIFNSSIIWNFYFKKNKCFKDLNMRQLVG